MKKLEENFSGVLRKSFIFSTLISGIFFTVKSLTASRGATGAFVGASPTSQYITLGIGLLLLALTLSHFHDKDFLKI